MSKHRTLLTLMILLAMTTQTTAEEFSTAQEAYSIGATYFRMGSFAKSQAPFEAAIKLSEDVEFRVECYRALLASYRLLESGEKMGTAVDYILEHSERSAEKSLTRRAYMSFLHQRGLTDEAVKRYEERLKANPKDTVALYVLAEIYSGLIENPNRAAELTKQLQALSPADPASPENVREQADLARQLSKAKKHKEAAELYESIAPTDASLAAWHWKEAATEWIKAKEMDRAKIAALESTKCEPESRNDQLTYFWSRNLADALLTTGETKLAVKYYELALKKTDIDGYKKDTQAKLKEARAKLKSK
jgi:tetratricopeptide (TPR) repeat protein